MKRKAKIEHSTKSNSLPSTCYSMPARRPTKEEMNDFYVKCGEAMRDIYRDKNANR